MQPWTRTDLIQVLMTHPFAMRPNIAKDVVNAILQQPTLSALSTNARSARFLLESVDQAHKLMRTPINWVEQLCDKTPTFVDAAVTRYIKSNALASLKKESERYLVAASVLHAIESGRDCLNEPEFIELPRCLQPAAKCLVDLNVECVGGVMAHVTSSIPCAVVVSPAIVIVLCALLGVPTRALSSWHVQELITALYEFRKQILAAYRPFVVELTRRRHNLTQGMIVKDLDPQARAQYESKILDAFAEPTEELHRILQQVTVIRTLQAVPEPSESIMIRVPILFGRGVIWMNGAPFANVIAWQTLYHCKRCAVGTKHAVIEIIDELKACGLLKHQNSDDPGRIILRWLSAVWCGTLYLDTKGVVRERNKTCATVSKSNSESTADEHLDANAEVNANTILEANHASDAFPFNLLNTDSMQETARYVSITKDEDGNWVIETETGEKMADLPELPSDFKMQFIISTNADEVSMIFDNDSVTDKKENVAYTLDLGARSRPEAALDEEAPLAAKRQKIDVTTALDLEVGDDEKLCTSPGLEGLLKGKLLGGVMIAFLKT